MSFLLEHCLFNLLHRGRQILEWSTPHNRTRSETRLTTTDCSGNGLFCSTLTLSKAVANETGGYRCFYKNLPVEDGKTSISVYVFIQGMIFICNFFTYVFNKQMNMFFITFQPGLPLSFRESGCERVGILQKCVHRILLLLSFRITSWPLQTL